MKKVNSSSNKVSTEKGAISNARVINLKDAINRVKCSYNEVVDGRKLYELTTDQRKVVKIDGWEKFFLVADEDEAYYKIPQDSGNNSITIKPCYIVLDEYNKLNTSSARRIVNFWLKKTWRRIWRPEGWI